MTELGPIPFPSDNPEALDAIGHIKCPICERPFSEHSLEEGREHWDKMHAGVEIHRSLEAVYSGEETGALWHAPWGSDAFNKYVADTRCPICERLFRDHDEKEFCDHRDELKRRMLDAAKQRRLL